MRKTNYKGGSSFARNNFAGNGFAGNHTAGTIIRKAELWVILSALLFVIIGVTAGIHAKAEEQTEIYTAEDLLGIAGNPSGNYILKCDIDMKGIPWTPVDFTGHFDGNHHAILNLSFSETSDALRTTYDGNYKTYDTHFAGLFGTLEDASVTDLTLLGVNAEVSAEEPCFIGSVAGFAERSSIEGCTVEGTLRLDVSTSMFGVGGIIGYGGDGSIKDCNADVTLICIDHDRENRDEQFMGGAYSAGYLDADGCSIRIDGYDSDHGYVHNGGLVGMYILYPAGTAHAGYIRNNRIDGMITFFEDNTDRRAYCKDLIGEVMNWTFENAGNSSDFVRNEIMDYSKDLLPHDCENAEFQTERTDGGSEEYAYTLNTCRICGEYSLKSDYEPKVHNVKEWTVRKEATFTEEGMEAGICADCGEEVYRIVPVKEEPPSEEISEEAVSEGIKADEGQEDSTGEGSAGEGFGGKDENRGRRIKTGDVIILLIIVLAAGVVVSVIAALRKRKK